MRNQKKIDSNYNKVLLKMSKQMAKESVKMDQQNKKLIKLIN